MEMVSGSTVRDFVCVSRSLRRKARALSDAGERFVNYKCVERANENMLRIILSVAVLLLMAVWMHAAVDAGRRRFYGIAYVKVKVTDV